MFAAIARYYSYVFHGLLALFLIAVSGVALAAGPRSLHLDMLPFTGATLSYAVFFGGLFGVLVVALAFLRRLPVLLLVWSLVVPIVLIKGYIFSSYGFESGGFRTAVALILGSLVAIPGPWTQIGKSTR